MLIQRSIQGINLSSADLQFHHNRRLSLRLFSKRA